jgi:Holliday junction resolvase RusA-like endonuclease
MKSWTRKIFGFDFLKNKFSNFEMNQFQIYAKIRLMSLNHAFASLKNGRRIKTRKYAEFQKKIKTLMDHQKNNWNAFNERFEPSKHQIHAHLEFITPELYTKAGTISMRSGDIGNLEKVLMDCVMTGKIDDSQIVQFVMRKVYGEEFAFFLDLRIVERNK